MDEVHAVRRQVGADVMALIAPLVRPGAAYNWGPARDNAFFMAGQRHIKRSSLFAHELGHVIGLLEHDRYSVCEDGAGARVRTTAT